ncbi:hypothetical protein MKX01_009817 [Papaver californicum]|nr:hypothetical protein MKX01_009817 [Papaver californicum]
MIIIDVKGSELYAVIPKNLILKFDKLIREGGPYSMEKLHLTSAKPKFRPACNDKSAFFRWNTSVTALDAYSVSNIPHEFCFSKFEALASNLQNIRFTCNLSFPFLTQQDFYC